MKRISKVAGVLLLAVMAFSMAACFNSHVGTYTASGATGKMAGMSFSFDFDKMTNEEKNTYAGLMEFEKGQIEVTKEEFIFKTGDTEDYRIGYTVDKDNIVSFDYDEENEDHMEMKEAGMIIRFEGKQLIMEMSVSELGFSMEFEIIFKKA